MLVAIRVEPLEEALHELGVVLELGVSRNEGAELVKGELPILVAVAELEERGRIGRLGSRELQPDQSRHEGQRSEAGFGVMAKFPSNRRREVAKA